MARSSWSGALTFAGFPFAIKAYNLHASASRQGGFKTLCDCHDEPIAQRNHCPVDDSVCETQKGVAVAKGVHKILHATTVSALEQVGKSVALDVEEVCPVSTLNLALATGAYVIEPDGPGVEQSLAVLWTTLKKTDKAIVTRWTPRGGSKDHILALYAGDTGVMGATLPFPHQRNSVPATDLTKTTVAPAQAAMFEQALTSLYPNRNFDPANFTSEAAARHADAIAKAIDGNAVPTAAAAPAAPSMPDLMAALEASLAAAAN